MEKYLTNYNFLKNICTSGQKETFARITLLSQDNIFTEQIEGSITSCNININRKSAIQRTCSLSLIVKDYALDDYLFYLKQKMKIEIGLLNNVSDENNYSEYINEKIIWFPMGIYLLSSYGIVDNIDGSITLSINGKDKMCLLNGDLGGIINAETDFGSIDEYDAYNNKKNKKIPIKEILYNILYNYAHEDLSKIFLEDIDDYGLNLQCYRGNFPVYFFIKFNGDSLLPENYTFDENFVIYEKTGSTYTERVLKNLTKSELISSELMQKKRINENNGKIFYATTNDAINNENKFFIKKIEYGQFPGYKLTELVYPGDLIGNIGDSVITILDKIKNMLGDFEYFYDVDGNFIFRKQQNWQTLNSFSIEDSRQSLITDHINVAIDFIFEDLKLISNLNVAPQLEQIKNDFTVWGNKPSAAGGETIPIHMRYAIDIKPTKYTNIYIDSDRLNILKNKYFNKIFFPQNGEDEEGWGNRMLSEHTKKTYTIQSVNWREILYQMAKDYNMFNQIDEYKSWLKESNPMFINGKTGYEQYYIDIEGFWRDIYQTEKQVFNSYNNDFIENNKYSIKTTSSTVTEIEMSINPIVKGSGGEKKDYSLLNLYWLESIDEDDDGEYVPNIKKIGNLGDIISTNYDILKRLIECLALNEISIKNKNLYKQISEYYPDIKYNNTLYFKDPKTVVQDKNNENIWIAPKNDKVLYHRFQEIYCREFSEKNSDYSHKVFPTYMSGSQLINRSSNDDTIKNLMDEVLLFNRSIEKNEFTTLYNEFGSINLTVKNCSTLFNPIENSDFEWFLKNASGYQYLGHYYPLNANSWMTTPISIKNKQNIARNFERLYILKEDAEKYEDASEIYDSSIANEDSINNLKDKINESYLGYTAKINTILNTLKINFNNRIKWNNTNIWTSDNNIDDNYKYNSIFGTNNLNNFDKNQLLYFFKILNFKKNNIISYFSPGFEGIASGNYWNQDLIQNPENLVFWIDFLDSNQSISKLSVKQIGQRPKVENNKDVTAIFYDSIFNNIFIDSKDEIFRDENKIKEFLGTGEYTKGVAYFNVGPNFSDYLTLGKQGIDAFTAIENLLYNYSYCGETISFNCIPLYFLLPGINFQLNNTIQNEANVYTLQSISININSNGTSMSINGTKTIEDNISRKEIYNV